MTDKPPDKPKKIDGFVCAGCGRTSYAVELAPLCRRCRALFDQANRKERPNETDK